MAHMEGEVQDDEVVVTTEVSEEQREFVERQGLFVLSPIRPVNISVLLTDADSNISTSNLPTTSFGRR